MPIISIQSDYVRDLGSNWDRYTRLTIEIKQFIQYRLLGNPEYQMLLGPAVYELQEIVRRLNEEGMLLESDVRRLYGIADQVESINRSGYGRPSWLSPGFMSPMSSFSASFSLPSLYRSPLVLNVIAQRIFIRRYSGYA